MPDRPQNRPSRVSKRRNRRRTGAVARPATTTLHSPPTQIVITPKVTAAASKDTTPDYSYVTKDLKNIGFIIGGIVVVFIVLYFIWK